MLNAYGVFAKEGFLEKTVYCLLIMVAFCLPLFPKAATVFVGFATLLALADNVISGKLKMTMSVPLLLLLAFACWAGFFTQNSPDYAASMYNFKVLWPQYILIYWLTISYVKSFRQSCGVLSGLLAASFLVAVYGIYQYFYDGTMLTSGWVDSSYFPMLKTRAFSTLYNPNILASFLVTSIALCLGGIFSRVKISVQMLLVLLAITSSACLVFTFSRSAWVSLLVVLLSVCVLYSYKLLYIFVPPFALVAFLSKDIIMQRFMSVFETGDTSALLRFALWESTVAMIRDNPLTGIGWGAYKFVYPYYDFFINNPDVTIYHAHNMYLNIAAELGIPGLVMFLLLLLTHFYFALRVLRRNDYAGKKAMAIGLSCVFIGIMVGGVTDHTLFNMELASIFWLLSALAYVLWQNGAAQSKIKGF